jgi:nucleotide-binding universal stress UspA family protein
MTETTNLEDVPDCAKPRRASHDGNFSGAREILVPIDLTVECRQVIASAVSLAKLWNSHLTLLHVYKEPRSLEYMRGPHVCAERKQQKQYTMNAFELLGDEAKAQYENCSTEFRQGILCDELPRAVRELHADLMIIGTHGNKWFRRIAYGSETDEIVRLAPCPVLVVRYQLPISSSISGEAIAELDGTKTGQHHVGTSSQNRVLSQQR